MHPGEHFWLLGSPMDSVATRHAGFQLRDTVMILTPGPRAVMAYLFRCPLEGTVVESVLKYGAGALWIDGCRVATSDNLNGGAYSGGSCPEHFFGLGRKGHQEFVQPAGRWSSNVLLVHHGECVPTGFRPIPGHKGYPNGPGGKSHHYSSSKKSAEVRPNPWKGHADENGLEHISTWECHERCPARLLDEQTGEETGAHGRTDKAYSHAARGWGQMHERQSAVLASTGGASRFYPQFRDFPEALGWLYQVIGKDPLVPTLEHDG